MSAQRGWATGKVVWLSEQPPAVTAGESTPLLREVVVVEPDAVVITRDTDDPAWDEATAKAYVWNLLGHRNQRPTITPDLLGRAAAIIEHAARAVIFLREHPPIDDEQVDAFEAAVNEALNGQDDVTARDLALHLVTAGASITPGGAS